MEDMKGGTFTISNGGVFGSLAVDPDHQPAADRRCSACTASRSAPVVRDGQIVARPMMYLALSYDHRLIDGREAVTFLVRIKEAIEDPTRLLIDDCSLSEAGPGYVAGSQPSRCERVEWQTRLRRDRDRLRARAAMWPRSAPRSSASRPPASRAARRWAAPASTSAASRPRRCSTRPSCTRRRIRARSPNGA